MRVKLFKKQEYLKDRKHFEENISNIYNLDDICTVIDELVERMSKVTCEYKDKHIQSLIDIKNDIIDEIKDYEDKNLDIMQIWED